MLGKGNAEFCKQSWENVGSDAVGLSGSPSVYRRGWCSVWLGQGEEQEREQQRGWPTKSQGLVKGLALTWEVSKKK